MMFNKLGGAILAFSLTLAVAPAAAEPIDQAALARTVERGRLMYRLDQAAWVSTDEMVRRLPNRRELGVAGWIVEPHGDEMRSTYYALKDEGPVAVFIVDSRGNRVVESHAVAAADAALNAGQRRMIAARGVATAQTVMRCTSGPMNSIVIPPGPDDAPDAPIDVYILSSQVTTGEVPFGGHQLFRIDSNGKVVARRQFTKACMNMPTPPKDAKGVAGLIVTHLLDTTPTEIHVFSSQAIGAPVFVGAPDKLPPGKTFRIWQADARAITLIQDIKP